MIFPNSPRVVLQILNVSTKACEIRRYGMVVTNVPRSRAQTRRSQVRMVFAATVLLGVSCFHIRHQIAAMAKQPIPDPCDQE